MLYIPGLFWHAMINDTLYVCQLYFVSKTTARLKMKHYESL